MLLALPLCFCFSFCLHNSLYPDRLTFRFCTIKYKLFLFHYRRNLLKCTFSSFKTLTMAWTHTCLSPTVLYFYHKTQWILISGDSGDCFTLHFFFLLTLLMIVCTSFNKKKNTKLEIWRKGTPEFSLDWISCCPNPHTPTCRPLCDLWVSPVPPSTPTSVLW